MGIFSMMKLVKIEYICGGQQVTGTVLVIPLFSQFSIDTYNA